ncbi:MAG: hypothetical protein QOH26_1569 [Actinomycetota bacterium]|jgi:hypothetical protein|nr:hypothetical protein [Actinomycetota bacterium]
MPATGVVATVAALLAFGFLEALRGFYPARPTWWRMRRARGRDAVRRTRERLEEAAGRQAPRILTTVLLCLLIIWVATASLLDKRWYEVVADAAPSLIVMLTLQRIPSTLRLVAERMKKYEREAGDDPDAPLDGGDGGATAIAL